MACVTMGLWCSSNVKMRMFPSMSSPRISCRSIPIPPLNPRDPFLSKLVSVATSENPETPPHLNLFENPKLMPNSTDQVESAVSAMFNEHTPRQHSLDLQSFLLRRRIVYIRMPLVPAATELVIAQLLYLQWMDPNQPIYLYINSSEMVRDDDVMIALEPESFAIYDTMMQLTNEIQTVAVGPVIGQACLLLAAGKKGRRFMFPHARVMIRPPHGALPGTRPTSDIRIGTDGAFTIRDTLVKLLAKHTGIVEGAVSVMYNEHTQRQHSPDLQSYLLRRRIVYIGKRLALDVVERVTAELLYLQWMDPNQPIYLYINSSGMTSDDGKTVAMEHESFAIYDTMMQLTNEIQTVAVGAAIGQACLLLAAGKKGRRFMLPHTRVMIRYPHFSHVEKQTSDVFIHTKQALKKRKTLENLLARHTGRSIKEVISVMRKPFFMRSTEARDFGIVDKILCCGQEEQMQKMNPPEDQDRKASIETVDGM